MAFTNAHGKTQTSLSDINVTPFVDVLLVLLVIFMLTAPILQSGIELDVPKTRTVREISQERLVVSIDRGQRLYLGNDPININNLGTRLRERAKAREQSVFLRADQTVPYGTVAMVVDELRQAGIQQISLVTEPLNRRR
jgi:biopolymer transport protein ExbD/biopolymer transport protein TolR